MRQRARASARAWIVLLALLPACAGRSAPARSAPAARPTPGPPRIVAGAVVGTIALDGPGAAAAVAPDGTRVYVTVPGGVAVIDASAGRTLRSIRTGGNPDALVMTRDGRRAYAVDRLQRELWAVDLGGARVAGRFALDGGAAPVLAPGIALSADERMAYVGVGRGDGQGFDVLRMVHTAGGDARQRGLDFHPGGLVVDRTGLLWITGCTGACSDGTLRLIDPGGIGTIAKVDLPAIAAAIALSSGGRRVFIANGIAGSISVFDAPTRSLVATVPIGGPATGVAASPDGRHAYAIASAPATLSAIDLTTHRVVAIAGLGAGARAVAVSPDGRRAWVTHTRPVVSVVDLTRLHG